jgi:hypothetical protein
MDKIYVDTEKLLRMIVQNADRHQNSIGGDDGQIVIGQDGHVKNARMIKEENNMFEPEKKYCSVCGKELETEIDTGIEHQDGTYGMVWYACPEYFDNGDEDHDSFSVDLGCRDEYIILSPDSEEWTEDGMVEAIEKLSEKFNVGFESLEILTRRDTGFGEEEKYQIIGMKTDIDNVMADLGEWAR